MSQLAVLVQALAALAWPAIIAFIVWQSRGSIKTVLDTFRSRGFTIKVAGTELTAQEASEQQQKLIADLQSQIVDIRETLGRFPSLSGTRYPESNVQPARVMSILWVDDNPKNNATLIANLNELRINVVTARSTAEGVATFTSQRFDRVVSDMGRTENGQYNLAAGIDLTRQIRAINSDVPIIFYSSSSVVQTYRDDALKAGATALTSSPTALLRARQSTRVASQAAWGKMV